jgi:serine/threonine protein kinase
MAPEAFLDSGVTDPRSDIYALGALGYFLLTAEYVFDGNSDYELYEKHLKARPVPPSQRTQLTVSPELEETLLRALEKEPNLRPQSVAEMRELLLTSPCADSWNLAARTAWWAPSRHGAVAVGQAAIEPVVKIDVPHDVKMSRAPGAGV